MGVSLVILFVMLWTGEQGLAGLLFTTVCVGALLLKVGCSAGLTEALPSYVQRDDSQQVRCCSAYQFPRFKQGRSMLPHECQRCTICFVQSLPKHSRPVHGSQLSAEHVLQTLEVLPPAQVRSVRFWEALRSQ